MSLHGQIMRYTGALIVVSGLWMDHTLVLPAIGLAIILIGVVVERLDSMIDLLKNRIQIRRLRNQKIERGINE